jgi:hypothetical protein
LAVEDHVHHSAARSWWSSAAGPFGTCPITQGKLLRLLLREGLPTQLAVRALGQLTGHPRHIFWPDSLGYEAIDLAALLGHGQVTDACLIALASHNQGRLVTLDRDLARHAPATALLLPV